MLTKRSRPGGESFSATVQHLQSSSVEDEVPSKSFGSNMISSGFTTGGLGSSIHVSAENVAKSDQLIKSNEEVDPSKTHATGFATAGSNTNIAVSEEGWASADHLINSPRKSDENTRVDDAKSTTREGNTKGLGCNFKPRDRSICWFDFTKGGLGVLTEELEEVSKKGGSPVDSVDLPVANQRVRFSLDNFNSLSGGDESHSCLLKEATSAKLSDQSPSSGVTIAGSSKGIHVSDENVARANSAVEEAQAHNTFPSTCHSGELGPKLACAKQPRGNSFDAFVTPDRRHLPAFGVDRQDTMHRHRKESETSPQNNASSTTNVVTDKKDTPLTVPVLLPHPDSAEHQKAIAPSTASLQKTGAFTPLLEMTNIAHNSYQSVIKSKRLFQHTANERETLPSSSSRTDGVPPEHEQYKQISLGEFAARHSAAKPSNWTSCIYCGVKDVTLRVTSLNATKLRFSMDDGSPLSFLGQRDPPKCSSVGKIGDISEWLINQGCDAALFSDKWIQNHYRWIVWKLASM